MRMSIGRNFEGNRWITGLAVGTLCALAPMARGQTVINWQSIGQEGQNGQHSVLNYSGQGAYSDAGNNYWNAITGDNSTQTVASTFTNGYNTVSASTLTDNGSTVSSIVLTLHNPRGGADYNTGNSATSIQALLGAGSDVGNPSGNGNGPGTFTIAGLTPGQVCSLYLYVGPENDATSLTVTNGVSADNSTNTESPIGNTGPLSQGGDYALFSVTADGSGDITGSWEAENPAPAGTSAYTYANNNSGSQAQDYGVLSGITLVIPSAPVPEPASIGLLGFAGLGILARRRRA